MYYKIQRQFYYVQHRIKIRVEDHIIFAVVWIDYTPPPPVFSYNRQSFYLSRRENSQREGREVAIAMIVLCYLTLEGGGEPESRPKRKHGSTRVPGHACLAWRAHDGWLLYIYYKIAAGNSVSSQLGSSCQGTGTVRKRQAVRPVHHVQNHTCRVTLLQPPRRAAVLGQPSSLRPH